MQKCSAKIGMSSRRSRSGGTGWNHVEAKKTGRHESPAADRGQQAARAGRHDPNIEAQLVLATYRPSAPIPKSPSQASLQDQRQLADIVEKQRPAMRALEGAKPRGAVPTGLRAPARKSSIASRSSGSAAQFKATKGPLPTTAAGVDDPRHPLFTAATLAGQQHRRV